MGSLKEILALVKEICETKSFNSLVKGVVSISGIVLAGFLLYPIITEVPGELRGIRQELSEGVKRLDTMHANLVACISKRKRYVLDDEDDRSQDR